MKYIDRDINSALKAWSIPARRKTLLLHYNILKLYTFFFLLLLFIPFSANGSNSYSFRHFNVENGLPQNTVSCIFQDRQGFMWFGTKDGLSRYDGYTFRTFKHDKTDKNSIGNNFIRSIFQGENEDIWAGTDIGAYIYHPDTESFSRFDLQTSDGISIDKEVNDIKSDKDGNI